MKKSWIVAALLAVAPAIVLADGQKLDAADQWPQWRGPLGTGVAPRGNPPVTWGEGTNIRWKIAIPGLGHSTPIIWGERIFLTTAVPFGAESTTPHKHAHGAHNNVPALRRQKSMLMAFNRRDGATLWQRTLHDERPHDGTHETGSWASNSPVTDGERVYASFGSRGLYCLDMNGELLWQTDVGDMQTKHGHGEGSSPALYGETLIINWDHEGGSFVLALDKRTGKERWKAVRDEVSSWSTPFVVEHEGRPQVIIAATKRVRAYDLDNGRVIWECGGLSGNVVASPVAEDGFVYVASSYETRAMLAIRLAAAKGDITNTDAVVWTRDRHTPYVPSPLLDGGMLFFLKHYQGFLTCVSAKTGQVLFGPERLAGIDNVFASLAGADGRVYIVSRNGATAVVKLSAEFSLLALNQLDDSFSASPAIVGDELYLRGERSLYCIAAAARD